MKLVAHSTQQKLRGGYYTPRELSDFIVRWAFQNGHKKKILEPSCGDGIFFESIINHSDTSDISCLGIELDAVEAEKSQNLVENYSSIRIINDDFFNVFEQELKNTEFDLILGNPPYIRYQYLTAEQREVQSKILTSNRMKSNKLINAWVSFVVASVQVLKEGGKVGLVIPAELLQVAYAEELRLFLVNHLSKITVITFKELIFPDVQQEVVLLLGEKYSGTNNCDAQISVVEVQNLSDLNDSTLTSPIEYKQVDHNSEKWTQYFLTNNEILTIRSIKSNDLFVKFNDVAKIDIGITTGNNKYFSVKQETVEKYDLSSVTLPLIGRSAHASGIFFDQEGWQENVNKGLLAQLVYFPDIPVEQLPLAHQAYIRWGEENEHNEGYKLGLRKRWFHIPSVWRPDAFFLRRNDMFPKFVLNKIDAVSTDTMHRIKFKEGLNPDKILLSYYNSITFAFTEIEGRSYGGGVLEVLPGELEKVLLPDIQKFPDNKVNDLLKKIDYTIRKNGDFEPILEEVDQSVLVDFLGISKETVIQFRGIWKKFMNRRRDRK
jgi:adenine-specific DNA-methyltransferase